MQESTKPTKGQVHTILTPAILTNSFPVIEQYTPEKISLRPSCQKLTPAQPVNVTPSNDNRQSSHYFLMKLKFKPAFI